MRPHLCGMPSPAGQLLVRFASLESLFEALASGAVPRLRGDAFVCVHPETLGEDAESEYWALSHGLACFGLAVVVSRRIAPPEVEVRAYAHPRRDADMDGAHGLPPPAA